MKFNLKILGTLIILAIVILSLTLLFNYKNCKKCKKNIKEGYIDVLSNKDNPTLYETTTNGNGSGLSFYTITDTYYGNILKLVLGNKGSGYKKDDIVTLTGSGDKKIGEKDIKIKILKAEKFNDNGNDNGNDNDNDNDNDDMTPEEKDFLESVDRDNNDYNIELFVDYRFNEYSYNYGYHSFYYKTENNEYKDFGVDNMRVDVKDSANDNSKTEILTPTKETDNSKHIRAHITFDFTDTNEMIRIPPLTRIRPDKDFFNEEYDYFTTSTIKNSKKIATLALRKKGDTTDIEKDKEDEYCKPKKFITFNTFGNSKTGEVTSDVIINKPAFVTDYYTPI